MKLMNLLLLIAFLQICCSRPETEASPEDSAISADWATQMLAEVNALRAGGCRCGSRRMPSSPPLAWNNQLAQAAQRHANDMHRNDFFSHAGSDGSNMAQRVREAGYDWRTVAENIAWGHPDATAVVQGWKDSAGHCKNMMSAEYTEMGAAQAGKYWVQDLGRR